MTLKKLKKRKIFQKKTKNKWQFYQIAGLSKTQRKFNDRSI